MKSKNRPKGLVPLNPKVDLIVVNWNGKHHLKKCLPSLLKTRKIAFSGYLVDNASTDGSAEYVERNFPKFTVIRNPENLGYSGAANVGIAETDGDLVCVLNNDIIVSPNWLLELVKGLNDPEVAIAVPKMYGFDGRLNAAGGACDIYGFAYNRGISEKDVGQYDSQEYVPYGGTALIKRSALHQVGIFDLDYVMYHEEVDLCWRIILRGYRVLYCPRSVVYHKHMGTTLTVQKRHGIIYYWERNRFQTLLKNYEIRTFVTLIPQIAILKVLHVIYALSQQRVPEAFAVIRAYWWNMRHLRKIIKKRRQVQLLRTVSDEELTKLMFRYSIELRLGLGKIHHPFVQAK